MLRKGLAVAVILLFIGVAFTSSINANVSKSSLDPVPDIETLEKDATPIALALQLMTKFRNHKEIQNIETEDDVLRIIEGDEELNSILEQLSNNDDCGCEEDSSAFTWRYPVLCTFLYPFFIISVGILFAFHIWQFKETMDAIGDKLDCFLG